MSFFRELGGCFTGKRDAHHLAAVSEVIIDGVMLNAAVVPHRDAVRLPFEAGLKIGFLAVLVEQFKDCFAFVTWQIDDV